MNKRIYSPCMLRIRFSKTNKKNNNEEYFDQVSLNKVSIIKYKEERVSRIKSQNKHTGIT